MGPSSPTAHGVLGVRSARSGAALFYRGGGSGNAQRHSAGSLDVRIMNSRTKLNPSSNALGSGIIVDPLPSVPSSLIRNDSDAIATLALLKTTAALFKNTPYVGMVASIVQQIIKIADDIRTNKHRCAELIDKVERYACVVFEALRSTEMHSRENNDDLEAELKHIASVLESIHKILQFHSDHNLRARVVRVIQRTDILGQIQEQDRRLDVLINALQFKTSIILRRQEVPAVSAPLLDSKRKPARRPPQLRPKPQIMFGRDRETQQIVELILEHYQVHEDSLGVPARLAVLGPGGIGKTSLALSVFHDDRIAAQFGSNRLFVSCEAAISVEHIISDLAYYLHITPELITGGVLDVILDRLRSASFLVILDNLETPWELSHARADVEALLQTLAGLSTVTVIITARGSQHPAGVQWTRLLPPLKPVSVEAAIAIFQAISHKVDDYVTRLVEAVDCLPLAVTLLGNLAAVDGETPEALWQRWCEESIGMVSESGDDRLRNLDCSIQLSLSSPRMRDEPEALALLSLLSLLPDGMTTETFKAMKNGIPGILNLKKAMATLRQNALVFVEFNDSICVLNPVRFYMISHHPPSFQMRCYLQDYFIALAHQGTKYSDAAINDRLCLEVGNIEAMLVDSLEVDRPLVLVVEAIVAFCHFTYVTRVGSSRAISLAVEKLDALRRSDTSTLTSQMGLLRSRTSSHIKISWLNRFHFWKVASPEPNSIVSDDVHLSLSLQGDCLGCLGQILSRQMRFEEAKEKFTLAIQFHIEAGDTAGHASDLHNLGCLLSKGTLLKEAEAHFEEAIILHERAGDTVGKAYDIMGCGHVQLLQRWKIAEAQTNFMTAMQTFIDNADELGQASAMYNLGQVSLYRSMFRISEEQFQRALQLNVKLGNLTGQAESMAGLAHSLLFRSRFGEARQRIEDAINLSSPIEDAHYHHTLGCVLIAQCNYDEARKHLTKARDLHRLAKDPVGVAEDSHYILRIKYYTGSLVDADRSLEEYQHLFNSVGDKAREADVMTTRGFVHSRGSPEIAKNHLIDALEIHTELGSIHDQAFDLHYLACLQLRQDEFNLAEENLLRAVQLHIRVENVQGQADAYNKLAEIQLRRQQCSEALAGICRALTLHAQANDIPGQGHDLYVQARILRQLSRLDEAESTIRKAVVLFSQLSQHYYQGRALAKLSAILWRRFKRDGMSTDHDEALETIDEAIRLFHFPWNEWDLDKAIAGCRCSRKEMVEGAPHTTCGSHPGVPAVQHLKE